MPDRLWSMAEPRARVLSFAVDLDEKGTAASDRGGTPLADDPDAWTPEHLLLAALARCTITSLRHHARRAGSAVAATATARGTVTRRETDGRFAFVEIELAITASLDPAPADDALTAILEKAERDCFVGASLSVPPSYRFTIDGRATG